MTSDIPADIRATTIRCIAMIEDAAGRPEPMARAELIVAITSAAATSRSRSPGDVLRAARVDERRLEDGSLCMLALQNAFESVRREVR